MSVGSTTKQEEAIDRLLELRGSGKHLWKQEDGDTYLRRIREGWDVAENSHDQIKVDSVLQRVITHAGEQFETATGLKFEYAIDGRGIWFYRDGRRINQKLAFSELEKAIRLCPLSTTTQIKHIRDYAYAFGLLRDRRIRGKDW